MPLVHHATSEVHLKLVYYGPGLGGKTTNLEYIHRRTKPEHRGRLVSLVGESERTLFFDLLPVELGLFRGYRLRLHLCTVPGQIALDRTRQLVLRHVDGVAFVVDSQAGRLEDNVASVRNLETNLLLQGDDPSVVPMVVQYNKRDLPGVLPVDELRRELRIPPEVPEFEASAAEGWGVVETLKGLVREVLTVVGEPRELQEGRSPSILPGRRVSMLPEARTPESGSPPRSSSFPIPKPAPIPRVPEDSSDDGDD